MIPCTNLVTFGRSCPSLASSDALAFSSSLPSPLSRTCPHFPIPPQPNSIIPLHQKYPPSSQPTPPRTPHSHPHRPCNHHHHRRPHHQHPTPRPRNPRHSSGFTTHRGRGPAARTVRAGLAPLSRGPRGSTRAACAAGAGVDGCGGGGGGEGLGGGGVGVGVGLAGVDLRGGLGLVGEG